MRTESAHRESLQLMQKLIEYRHQKPLHHRLLKAAEYSMLGEDVLVLLYHLARICEGDVLEIGSFVGGSTTAVAMGIRDSYAPKQFVSIEPGGRLDNHRLATKDIFKQLKKNLARAGVDRSVQVINANSSDEVAVVTVRALMPSNQIGLFVFDAEWNLARDIECYGKHFKNHCWMVIDDYLGAAAEKAGPIRAQVDELVAAGRMEPLGYYGWGTWVGRWLAPSPSSSR